MDPDREDELADRGRALIAGAVAETRAPMALRQELARAGDARPARRRRGRGVLAGLAATCTAILVAVFLVVPGEPTVAEAASAANEAPEHGAPAVDRGDPAVLRVEEGGVRFPTWRAFGWRATGTRTDQVGGRDITTVFYEGVRGGRLAYSIVDGEALERPNGTSRTLEGVRMTVLRHDGHRLVTWERDGRTCIVAASANVPLDTLLALPTWD